MDRRNAGGIAAACRLLVEHGGAIEADLQRYYGLHIGDFPWPLTARRLHGLLARLPEDARLIQELAPSDARGWTDELLMLATVIDELRVLGWIQSSQGRRKRTPPPEPIPRPGVTAPDPPRRRRATPEQVRARFAERGIPLPDQPRDG